MVTTLEEEFAAYGGGNEYRWIGPPGCGKTHKAAHLAAWAARKYGPEKVVLTSFSKAAAAILRGRTDIPKENVGTLHSLALRAIGGLGSRRNVVSSRKGHLKLFSEKYPRYAIQAVRTVDNDGSYSTAKSDFPGEALLNERDRLAELLRDQEAWKPEIRYFHDAWERFKEEEGLIDFHDMIRIAYEDTDCAPGDPDVMVCDEAQDFSLLQTRLIRKWGLNTQFFILIGDDDQCVYQFRGASPDSLIDPPIKSDHYGILDQSYRVPRQVHAYATKWIERVDPDHRLAKEYKPRDADGVVSSIDATYREPFNVINDAAGQLKNGRSVMFIATCNYMLHEMIRIMRQNGVPYSNKYSPGNNYWNPLKRHKFMHGLLSFLPAVTGDQRAWTVEELCSWADCLKGMARKWRDKISDVPLQVAADEKILDMVLGDKYDALFDAMDKGEGLQFFLGNTLAEYRDDLHRDDKYPGTMQYVENVIASGGVETLYNQELINRVTIGTIHSVKGGEADVVYLFPDIPEAMKMDWNYNTNGSRDDIYRLFYVGMTRAREELVLAAPAAQTLAVRFA